MMKSLDRTTHVHYTGYENLSPGSLEATGRTIWSYARVSYMYMYMYMIWA